MRYLYTMVVYGCYAHGSLFTGIFDRRRGAWIVREHLVLPWGSPRTVSIMKKIPPQKAIIVSENLNQNSGI